LKNIAHKWAKEVSEILCRLVSDQSVLFLTTTNFGVNVLGPRSRIILDLFKDQAKRICEYSSSTSCELRQIGYRVPSLQEKIKFTRLGDVPVEGKWPDSHTMIRRLLDGQEKLVIHLVKDQKKLEQIKEASIGNYLTKMIRSHRQLAMELRVHLEDDTKR